MRTEKCNGGKGRSGLFSESLADCTCSCMADNCSVCIFATDMRACSFYSFCQLLCFRVRKLAESGELGDLGSAEREEIQS